MDDSDNEIGGGGNSRTPPNNIILMGVMGAGKSTIGWTLSRLIGRGFIDIDHEVERRAGKSIAKIFASDGEGHFRRLERGVIKDYQRVRNYVLAIGGGAVSDDESWQLLQDMGSLVWLNPSVELVARRLIADPQEMIKRPLIEDLVPSAKPRTGGGRRDPDDEAARVKALTERLGALVGQRQSRYKQARVIFESGYETPEMSAKILHQVLVKSGVLKEQKGNPPFDRWG